MHSLSSLKEKIELYIQEWIGAYEHLLYKPVQHLLKTPAKRSRPVLAMLGFRLFNQQNGLPESAGLKTALAVEVFHNFTLAHDDIMDNAPTRRGHPTVHEAFDVNTAILAGDVMQTMAFQLLSEANPAQSHQLIQEFCRVSSLVCEGQMEDMSFAHKTEVPIPDYIEMIRKKTAVLMGTSICLGALTANADLKSAHILRSFGETAGIGFQLQDDLMDSFPPSEDFGKQAGGDIIENKKTWLWIRAFEKANVEQKKELTNWLSINDKPDQKVKAVKQIYTDLNIAAEIEVLIQEYYTQADALLKEIGNIQGIELLTDFLKAFRVRKK